MRVLGIETSCDETAAAVVGIAGIESDVVWTQLDHSAYGGIVPEVAARAHIVHLPGIVEQALSEASGPIDAVACTVGPGLIGALLVGVAFGRALAAAKGVPFVPVHHVEAHALAPQLCDPAPALPYLALVVSGGHTALFRVDDPERIQLLATTVDDAAGEAFDKVARLLGLGWPGGPEIDRLAATGNPAAVPLPRPTATGLDWSFAGLKTAVRTALKANPAPADVAASFQAAVVDVLLDRCRKAMATTGLRQLALGGGVAANSLLRTRAAAELPGEVFIPPGRHCTDNAAMIAHAGRLSLLRGTTRTSVVARPSWAVGQR